MRKDLVFVVFAMFGLFFGGCSSENREDIIPVNMHISGVDDIAELGWSEGYDFERKIYIATGMVSVQTGKGASIDLLRIGAVIDFLGEMAEWKNTEIKIDNYKEYVSSSALLEVENLKIVSKEELIGSSKKSIIELYIGGNLFASYYDVMINDSLCDASILCKEQSYEKFIACLAKSGLPIKVVSERMECELPNKFAEQMNDGLDFAKRAINIKGGEIMWESVIVLNDKDGVLCQRNERK
jgi:hypothetical protein